MKEHNLRRMLQMGVCVTINSDDPAYFGGYMNENFLAAQRDLELTKDELVKLSANAIKASFIDENARQVLTAELNEYYRKNV